MRLAILSFNETAAWGGSDELWAATARKALAEGHQVIVSVRAWDEEPAPLRALELAGAQVTRRQSRVRATLPQRVWRKLAPGLPSALEVLAHFRPDVVCVNHGGCYCSQPFPELPGLLDRCGCPYVVLNHSADDRGELADDMRERFARFYERAWRVGFPAQATQRQAELQLGIELANGFTFRNPCNLKDYSICRWPSAPVPTMAYVGRITVMKGMDLLLAVFGGEPWKQREFKLRLYGTALSPGYFQEMAQRLGLSDKVEFCGHTDEVRAVWEDCHLFVLPSRLESAPLSLVEAMLCGRPAVVTDVGGMTDWVQDGASGFVAPCASRSALAGAFERAWEARADWEAMGQRAAATARQLADPDAGGTLLTLLKQAVAECGGRPAAALSDAAPSAVAVVNKGSTPARGARRRLIIVSTLPLRWGGSEELWADAAHEALDAGWEVRACVSELAATHRRVLALARRGVEFIFRSESPRQRPSLARRLAVALRHRLLPGSLRSRNAQQWDVTFAGGGSAAIISQGGTYCALGLPGLLPRLGEAAMPYVVLCHSCRERARIGEHQRLLARAFLGGAAKVGFDAEENRRAARRQLAADLPNSLVVQNPVHLADTSAVPWPVCDTPNFACVGRLEVADKGQDLLLAALAGDAWKSGKWRCTLYGSGPDGPYLQALRHHFGLDERVTFAGHVENVREIWSRQEILVLPSRSEGTPLTLIEAMLSGRPSVVTDVGGNADWVREGVTGFVAEAPTVAAMDRALRRACETRHRWQQMGEAARTECVQRRDPYPGRTLLELLAAAAMPVRGRTDASR